MSENGTKTTPVFLAALGHYFKVWSPYYQKAQCNKKTPIPASLR